MSAFVDNDITNTGRALLAEVQLGATFEPTKIVMGSGYIPVGSTARDMTAVVAPEATLEISKWQKNADDTVTVGGVYSNEDITEGFYYRELALYAKATKEDGTEVPECLYSYGNAGDAADYMTAYTTGDAVERVIDLVTYIGNDTEVNLTVGSGVYIPTTQKGAPNGVAELDGDGKVPTSQLPDMDYIPNSEKGEASGVATLDSTGKLTETQLPDSVSEDIEAVGKQLSSWWLYIKENYDYTCDMPSDTSTKPYSYTETAKEGETVKGTLVTTMNADGTYTEAYTIGTTSRTRTWSKVDNQWKGEWS